MGAGTVGQRAGPLAAASRWTEVASPAAHCAKRLAPAPAGSAAAAAAEPVWAAEAPAGSWGSWGAALPVPSAGQGSRHYCWCCARLHSETQPGFVDTCLVSRGKEKTDF